MNNSERKKRAERLFHLILPLIYELVGHKEATEELELTKVGKELFGENFLGVFGRGETTSVAGKGEMKIINNIRRGEGGEHWVAVYEDILFDSFGRAHFFPEHEGKETEYDVDQRDEQEDCGQRCLAFLCVAHLVGRDCIFI